MDPAFVGALTIRPRHFSLRHRLRSANLLSSDELIAAVTQGSVDSDKQADIEGKTQHLAASATKQASVLVLGNNYAGCWKLLRFLLDIDQGDDVLVARALNTENYMKYKVQCKSKGEWPRSRVFWAVDTIRDVFRNTAAASGGAFKTLPTEHIYFGQTGMMYTLFDGPFAPGYGNRSKAFDRSFAILVVSAVSTHDAAFEADTARDVREALSRGVQRIVVAINKMDHPYVKWDKGRYGIMKQLVSEQLSVMIQDLNRNDVEIEYVPVSAINHFGTKYQTSSDPYCEWYGGEKSLMELLL